MLIERFAVYQNDNKILLDNQSIDNLYADYIDWLIKKKIKTAPVSELLFQLRAISEFVEKKALSELFTTEKTTINVSVTTAIKNIFKAERVNHDSDAIAILTLAGAITGIVCLIMLGISFAPLQSGAPSALRTLSIWIGACSAFALGVSGSLKLRTIQYHKTLNKEIDAASQTISNTIKETADNQINPVQSAVTKTLLIACGNRTAEGAFAVMDSKNNECGRAENAPADPYVDLANLSYKLRA